MVYLAFMCCIQYIDKVLFRMKSAKNIAPLLIIT